MNRQRLLSLIGALTLVTLLMSTCGAPPATPTSILIPTPESPTPADREAALVSLEEAAELVLAELVKSEDLDHEVIIFCWPEPLEPGDRLQSYLGPDLRSPGEVFPIGDEAWFFWVDDAPGAFFVHDTRFVLVDRATGEVSTSEEEWWPVLNGESLWTETEVYWDEANWAFSNVEWRPSRLDQSAHPQRLAKPLPHPPLTNGSPGAALVVNGWQEPQSSEEDMQTDAEGMHESYSNSGFDTEQIGPPRDPASREGILSWIRQQSTLLQPCQTAIIYIVGHGGAEDGDGLIRIGRDWLTETDLANALREFNPGVHLIVTIQSCNSGSWSNGLREVGAFVITSGGRGAQSASYGDYDPVDKDGNPLDPNPWDQGSEFTSGLKEDYDQIMADPAERERVAAAAERREGQNFWQALHEESFFTAVEKDASYQYLGSHPEIWRGPEPEAEEEEPTPEPGVEEEEPTPPPAPEPGAALPEEQALTRIDDFAQTWNAYMASGNVDGLLAMLFYPVFERYNRPQCRTELDRATGNPVRIEVLEVTWIGTWFWETDGLSTQLENVYAVLVRMTAGGESWEQEIHLVVLPDGSVWWLTDCGTPPTPTREPGAEPTTCYQEITAPARTAASIPFLLEWYGDPDHGDFELEFSADGGPWTRLPLDDWYPEGGHNKATITLNVGEGVLNVRVCRTGPSPCCGDIYQIIIYLESEPCH